MSGPAFLGVYVLAGLIVSIIGMIVRARFRGTKANAEELDAYGYAVLAASPDAAIEAAVAQLKQAGALSLEKDRFILGDVETPTSYRDAQGKVGHPLEQAVINAVRASGEDGITASGITEAAIEEAEKVETSLADRGMLLSASTIAQELMVQRLLFALYLGAGIARMIQGVSRGRPVGILVALMICAVIIFSCRKSLRLSSGGEARLSSAKYKHEGLKTTAEVDATQLSAADAALAVALFGPHTIPGLESVYAARVVATTSSGGGYGCSSCSSCGGGCGGGCGGCGG